MDRRTITRQFCGSVVVQIVLLAGLNCCTACTASADEPATAAGETAVPSAEARTKLDEVIAAVRKNEVLFRNLDATYRTSWKFHPQPPARPGGMSMGQPVIDETVETHRQATQGDRLYFSGDDVVVLKSGKKPSGRTLAVSDGNQTVVIAEGNSATVFQRRCEPPAMFPPHCWGLFTLEVNFPLSEYLQGTEVLKSNPKVGRFAVERGSTYEFYKVEAEWMGEEPIDKLPCVKIKVKRWHYTKSPPVFQYLWLAKDRNYHVAQCRTAWVRNAVEVPGDTTRVVKWRELKKGVWLPTQVDCESFTPNADEKKPPIPRWTRRLVVALAALDPALPDELFQLPPVPDALPKFVVGPDGRLVDGPLFPRPVTAAPGTTLDAIIGRLAAEEAKYDRIEVATADHYVALNRSELHMGGGLIMLSQGHARSVVSGKRLVYRGDKQSTSADGGTSTTVQHRVFDGRQVRGIYRYTSRGDQPHEQTSASFSLAGPREMQLVRAHTTVFEGYRSRQSLAVFLKSGWVDDHNKYAMTVEYVGDELIGDLHCHKLKCVTPHSGDTVPDSYSFVWLARDRNLIAVRHESFDPAWIDRLPAGLSYVDDLREIRHGIWFPYNTTILAFQNFSREGLVAGRPLLQWRQDIRVESLTPDPVIGDADVSILEVDEGTQISVRDARGENVGQFKQPQTGNIDVTPEKLLELRLQAQVSREEAARRQEALDALIGKPAPALPRDGWLNSPALTWKDLAGKIVVIDFWAIWCGPCAPDLARLADVHKAWQDNGIKDRVLLGIHTTGTDREAVQKAAAENKLGYPIIIDWAPEDGQCRWGDLFDQFAVFQIPFTIVVDRHGQVAAHGRLEEMLAKAGQLASEQPSK